ncbi:MAG: hypothetical protein LBC99_06710 [Spirochaetota bacterium]|jgi:cob(I)alamin adenosyltransferase|nr:hypothetical protein [Spirochaetota bacterium]
MSALSLKRCEYLLCEKCPRFKSVFVAKEESDKFNWFVLLKDWQDTYKDMNSQNTTAAWKDNQNKQWQGDLDESNVVFYILTKAQSFCRYHNIEYMTQAIYTEKFDAVFKKNPALKNKILDHLNAQPESISRALRKFIVISGITNTQTIVDECPECEELRKKISEAKNDYEKKKAIDTAQTVVRRAKRYIYKQIKDQIKDEDL